MGTAFAHESSKWREYEEFDFLLCIEQASLLDDVNAILELNYVKSAIEDSLCHIVECVALSLARGIGVGKYKKVEPLNSFQDTVNVLGANLAFTRSHFKCTGLKNRMYTR